MSAFRAENIGGGMMTVTKDGVIIGTWSTKAAIELIEKLTAEERRNGKRVQAENTSADTISDWNTLSHSTNGLMQNRLCG